MRETEAGRLRRVVIIILTSLRRLNPACLAAQAETTPDNRDSPLTLFHIFRTHPPPLVRHTPFPHTCQPQPTPVSLVPPVRHGAQDRASRLSDRASLLSDRASRLSDIEHKIEHLAVRRLLGHNCRGSWVHIEHKIEHLWVHEGSSSACSRPARCPTSRPARCPARRPAALPAKHQRRSSLMTGVASTAVLATLSRQI